MGNYNVFIESFIRAVLLSRYVASYLRLLRIYIFMGGPKLARGDHFWLPKLVRGDRFWRRTDFFVTDQRVKLVKIQLAKDIMQWLENLETWLTERLSAIFDENKVPDNKILEETEKFIDELNRAMKPPAVEEVFKNMESTTPSTSATKM